MGGRNGVRRHLSRASTITSAGGGLVPAKAFTKARAVPFLPSPRGGGSARYRAQRDARRGGVISQLGHCSKRETVTPPRRSTGRRFASPGRVDPPPPGEGE